MKICNCPEEVPPPPLDIHADWQFRIAQEAAHKAALKEHLLQLGYTGSNTGRELAIPHADGYARYMFADAGRQSCLILLPYGDAWHSPQAQYMPRKAVLAEIQRRESLDRLFEKRNGE